MAVASRLVGRATECARIAAVVERAVNARAHAVVPEEPPAQQFGPVGSTVLVTGDPGMGKTRLLEETAALMRGAGGDMLRCSGVESELGLPYAALHQLLRPAVTGAGHSGVAVPRAVAIAIQGGSDPTPDLYAVALGTLDLLAELSADRGLAVLVDDAHWLDESTARVLAFVSRRLEAEQIVLMATLRNGRDSVLLDVGAEEIAVGPLDPDAALDLARGRRPGLDAPALTRLLALADGNPLALEELPDRAPAGESVTLTARLLRAFTVRMEGLDDDAHAVVQCLAANDRAGLRETQDAAGVLRGHPIDAESLDRIARTGAVDVVAGALKFRHPLARQAVYQSMESGERRAAHAALAEVLADDPDRAVWHRASSLTGSDAAVAEEMDRAAERALTRGDRLSAVRAFERAHELDGRPDNRVARALVLAELLLADAQPERAAVVVEGIDGDRLDPAARARRALIEDAIDPGSTRDPGRILRLVRVADDALDVGRADIAIEALGAAAPRAWAAEAGVEATVAVLAGVERAAQSIGAHDPRILSLLAYLDPERAADELSERVRSLDPASIEPEPTALVSNILLVGADPHFQAVQVAVIDQLRAAGRFPALPPVLVQHAWTAICLGDWRLAGPASHEGERIAHETHQPLWEASAIVTQGMIAGMRGDPSLAAAQIARAESMSLPFGLRSVLSGAQLARGVGAIAEGRWGEAFVALRRKFDPADPSHSAVQSRWALGDLAEAAWRCGRIDEVRDLITTRRVVAPVTPWQRMAMQYARPFLAQDADQTEEAFRAALADTVGRWPTYRARMLLEYGSWLRRNRRSQEARDILRPAREAFDAFGMRPWAGRARVELRAAGEASGEAAPSRWEELSPQELQVARMAAEGLSNREIGMRLFLSHRTVGSHLYRVFPKLGVSHRSQLAAAIGLLPH